MRARLTRAVASALMPVWVSRGVKMTKKGGVGFVLGVCGGIILGALIDNMAIGLLLGFAVGFGVLKFGGDKKTSE